MNAMAEEKKVPAKGAKKGSFWVRKFGAIGKFFRDTKSELKKVVYPTPKQMVNNTLVVLLCVLVVGACVWVLDAVGGLAVKGIVSLVQG